MINEIFGEQYNGDEEVEFFPNEHFLDRQDAADRERITDTNFRVTGKTVKNIIWSARAVCRTGRWQSEFLSTMPRSRLMREK